jgi:PKD repeat protein
VWRQGSAEPATPTLSRTDTTAELQQPGGYGLAAYRSASATTAVTVRVGPFQVTGPGAPAANAAPTASFTATPTGLAVAVDASASADPDGTVASWAWAFGDGGTATGKTATHTYAGAGSYPVTLTVTDNAGATASRTSTVAVTAPTSPATARDTFARTVSGGWGTADLGGAWTAAAGATRLSVSPGYGEMRLDAAGQNTGAYLGALAQTRTDLQTTVTATSAATGSGTYVYLTGRRVAGQGEYRVRLRLLPNGQVAVALSRLTGTTEAFPGGETTVAGLTWAVGTPLAVDLQVLGAGTTTVQVTVWTAGTAQPATPTRSWTDTTAVLQATGGVGLAVHRPSDSTGVTALRFGPLTVTALP